MFALGVFANKDGGPMGGGGNGQELFRKVAYPTGHDRNKVGTEVSKWTRPAVHFWPCSDVFRHLLPALAKRMSSQRWKTQAV